MDKKQSRASTASSVSTSSGPRKSLTSRTKQPEENDVFDPQPRRTRFNSDLNTEISHSRISVARVKYSYTSVGSRDSRASIGSRNYSMVSSASRASIQPDTSVRPRQSMSRRVSTVMGEVSSANNPSTLTAPRRSVAYMQGGETDLPRRSMVGISRIQLAINQQSTVPRVPKPPIKHESISSGPDAALILDQERQWAEEKDRRNRLETLVPEKSEINLFEHDKPCCKSRRDPKGAVGYDPSHKIVEGSDLGYQGESISVADRDKRRSTSSIKRLNIGKGCPSEHCMDKNLPNWVDGHGNLDNIKPEISEYSSAKYERPVDSFDLDSPIDSVDINLQSYISASKSSSLGRQSEHYARGSMTSMGSRGGSLIREDSMDNGRSRITSKNGSKSSKGQSINTRSVNNASRGRSKASIYDSMTSKDDSMAKEYKSIEYGNGSYTSVSKGSKKSSKTESKRSKHGSKKSKGKSRSTKTKSKKSLKFKSKSSQTEEKDTSDN